LDWAGPDGLWAITDQGQLWHSTDTGRSWRQRGRINGQPEAFLVHEGRLKVAVSRLGVVTSTDQGRSWQVDALADAQDPGGAFFTFFATLVHAGAANRGLAEALAGAGYDLETAAARAGTICRAGCVSCSPAPRGGSGPDRHRLRRREGAAGGLSGTSGQQRRRRVGPGHRRGLRRAADQAQLSDRAGLAARPDGLHPRRPVGQRDTPGMGLATPPPG
jgi:hypothetical protein